MRDITLAILAGGEGRRMGTPKALLQIQNKPILEFLLDRIAWEGPTLLITSPGRENPPGANRFDREVADAVPGKGPLRGVLTALQSCPTNQLVVCTVDMPLLEGAQIEYVVNRLTESPPLHGLLLKHGNDFEPFPFACRKSAAPQIEQQLTRQRRSMHALADLPGFKTEPAPTDWPARAWTNLNTPDDLKSLDDL